MRRLVVGFAVLAVAIASGGCTFDNLYYDLWAEFDIAGKFERVTCLDFPNTPFELPAGPANFYSRITPPAGHEGEFPSKLNARLVGFDDRNRLLFKNIYKFNVNSSGEVDAGFELKEGLVPLGGRLCIDAQAKGGMIYNGSAIRLHVYRMVTS